MAQEIELKLRLASAQIPALKRALRTLGAQPQPAATLINTYFDTPDLSLRAARVALRLRKHGRRWLQTVKTAGQAQGGMSSRSEWEIPYPGHFDFSGIDDSALRARLETSREQLAPVFTTNFRRSLWHIEHAGAHIEVALDSGHIEAGAHTESILELELELLSGPPEALTQLHGALNTRTPLAPENRSKAERGYRLNAVTPVSSAPTNLPASTTETGMDLLLWRHAEAEDTSPDLARKLTRRGEQQARNIAAWLKAHQPRHLRVIASPATRCQQTAAAFTEHFETLRALAPGKGLAEMLAASGWGEARGAVLVVGHQPTLGQLAALLLGGCEANWSIKKGALWWFSSRVRDGESQVVLRAVIPPDLAGR